MKLLTIALLICAIGCVPAETTEPDVIQHDTVQPEKVYDTIAPTDKPVDTTLDALQ